jgi:hypothetical protein
MPALKYPRVRHALRRWDVMQPIPETALNDNGLF